MKRERRQRRHPLAGEGPIAIRARAALKRVAAEFGEVTAHDNTSVTVRTADGIPMRLSYELGNFVFSRVYNLTVSVRVPDAVPAGLSLSHKDRTGARFVSKGVTSSPVHALNRSVAPHLTGIDMLSSRTSGAAGSRTLQLTPIGGSYVWVLIPPVFKATAFPPGEPDRLLALVREVRGFAPTSLASS